MKQPLKLAQFADAINAVRPTTFSYPSLRALFHFVGGLREYASMEELRRDYPEIRNMEELEEATCVIPVDGDRFIIQIF